MKVMSFHLMPYADLDLSVKDKYRTVWIVLPNSYYDPQRGHALYNRYLDELELCAELGFDGICVNEHHQNAYGLMPSPVVRRRIAECHNLMGFQELVCMLQFGTLPGHLTEKNIRLFAAEVMPAIKTLTEKDYRGFELPKVAAE